MVITRKSDFDYTHLFYVIGNEQFSELELNWNAYDTNVQQFIEKSRIHTITIVNYKKGSSGLRQILESSELSFVSIKGEELLPRSFIKEAEKQGVHVLFNNQTVVRGRDTSYNSTLRLQLQLQMVNDLERLARDHDLINEIVKRDIKEKGGRL